MDYRTDDVLGPIPLRTYQWIKATLHSGIGAMPPRGSQITNMSKPALIVAGIAHGGSVATDDDKPNGDGMKMTELEMLMAKMSAENVVAENKVPGYTKEEAIKQATWLKKWAKGKSIVRQTSDSTFWAAGKWMTKLTHKQATSLVEHGLATITGSPQKSGAVLKIL